MEACDLERSGHEQSRHGQEAEEHRPSDSGPSAALTTYLTFLEHKIGHLRGILCSTPRHPQQQRAIVSAELRCIIVQLVSIANDLASDSSTGGTVDASPSEPREERSPSPSNGTHDDSDEHAGAGDGEEEEEGEGPYEVVQIEKEEILAPHAHCCKVCGKGFKRDANLRMHMRGHGDQYKAPGALARHGSPAPAPVAGRRFFYSCPYAGCKRNREHRDFQPLKTPVCVKNHYRRSHCDKSHVCRRCGVKRFSVLADLRTHEKHCGRDRWVCSCGVSFSRKDKLFAHVAVFDSGHTPALPPSDDEAIGHCNIAPPLHSFNTMAFSATLARRTHVAILGASGGIGQPLSLLCKLNPLVSKLSLYDIRLAPGVAADVDHCNTPSKAVGFGPENNGLEKALEGAEIVIIPAGMPRKPGMTRDDLFNANASIVRDLAEAVAKVSPKARIGVIANPVNSTVPIVAEVFKKAGVYDPKRLFGVTTLDIVRASAFLSGIAGTKPSETDVPVVGGHSGPTIVPLLSQLPAGKKVVEEGGEKLAALVKRIQFGGDEVVKAKDGAGSATLSMAYAGVEWANALLKAMHGESGVKLCTYVESPLYADKGVSYFASPVEISSEGTVAKIHPVGDLHPTEEKLLEECLPALAKNIEAGVNFINKA